MSNDFQDYFNCREADPAVELSRLVHRYAWSYIVQLTFFDDRSPDELQTRIDQAIRDIAYAEQVALDLDLALKDFDLCS